MGGYGSNFAAPPLSIISTPGPTGLGTSTVSVESQPAAGGAVLQLIGEDKRNDNLLRANADSTLQLSGFTLTQNDTTGQIVADGGKVEILGAANVIDGALITDNGGFFETSGAATLTDVTSEGTYNVVAGSTLSIAGSGLTNNGTLTINSNNASFNTSLLVAENAVFDGSSRHPHCGIHSLTVLPAHALHISPIGTPVSPCTLRAKKKPTAHVFGTFSSVHCHH